MLNEAKFLRPRSRPRPEPENLEVEAEAIFKRPRPNLKRPNRILYFIVKIYAVKTLANAISFLITLHAF